MATNYYATATWAATFADYISRIETALLAVGWTVYDSISSTHAVYRPPNVNGATGVFFMLELVVSGGVFTINACLDWDPVTHTPISRGQGTAIQDVGGTGYIYSNALGFFFVVIDGLYNHSGWAGQPRCRQVKNQTDGLCVSTAGMSIGATSVTVNANLTGRLYVGQVVAIQNFAHDSTSANKDNRELVTITSVSASTLSFSATTNAYDAGAKIGPPDMLWPLSITPAAFQSYNGRFMNWSTQATGLNQAGTVTSTSTASIDIVNASTGIYAGMTAANAAGLPPETFVGGVGESEVSDFSSCLPVPGVLFSYLNFSGGNPASGTKFTDGTNVFVLPKGGSAVGGALPSILVGPTGDTPNFSTQNRILPPLIAVSDSIYTYPSAFSTQDLLPSNGLNQGLN